MFKIIGALLGGMALGFALAYFSGSPKPVENAMPVVRDIANVPRISESAALKHRQAHFSDITSIEAVFTLPTEFARSEALHALAGRAGSEEVQRLIFDAERIADEMDRHGALSILFFRLAEIDPASALALSKTAPFRHNRSLREIIWQTWARTDLAGALDAAQAQGSRNDRNLAAQGIFSAYDYMANKATDAIEATLGIGPDRATRSRFLHRLISRSPEQAIAYINAMRPGARRDEYIWWLAYEMTARDGQAAASYADLFTLKADAERFRQSVQQRTAAENPRRTIESILASGAPLQNQGELHMAIRELASTDLDAAMRYLSEAGSPSVKALLGSVVASEFATQDPAAALAWARTNDVGSARALETAVLRQIAQTDPHYAIAEAQAGGNAGARIVVQLLSEIAQRDPAGAATYLALIENRQRRDEVETQLAATWLQQDSDQALSWILSHDEPRASQLLSQSSWALLNADVDSAIGLLPRLSENDRKRWRRDILNHLSVHRPPAEAEAFLRRFEGQPGYDQLRANYIAALSRTDTARALQMADQLTDTAMREATYSSIITQLADREPRQAAAMLAMISSEQNRGQATVSVATAWYRRNPEAAQTWVKNLPRGQHRDKVIMQLAANWQSPTPAQLALVESIRNDQTRGYAKLQLVYGLMNSDLDAARQLLGDADIPDELRAQVEAAMLESEVGFD